MNERGVSYSHNSINIMNTIGKIKTDMSYVVGLINENGIVIAGDSRESYKNTYNDNCQKVFKSDQYIWGTTGIIKYNHIDYIEKINKIIKNNSNFIQLKQDIIQIIQPVSKDIFINTEKSGIYTMLLGKIEMNIPKLYILQINQGKIIQNFVEIPLDSIIETGSRFVLSDNHFSFSISKKNILDLEEFASNLVKEAIYIESFCCKYSSFIFGKQKIGGNINCVSITIN